MKVLVKIFLASTLIIAMIIGADIAITGSFDNGVKWDDKIKAKVIRSDGQEREYDKPEFPLVNSGDTVILKVMLPEKERVKDGTICFYTYHSVIKGYYGNKKIFQKEKKIYKQGKMIGKSFVSIYIPEEAWGESIDIHLEAKENSAFNSVNNFYMYPFDNSYRYISAKNLIEFIITLNGMCLSVLSIILILIFSSGKQRKRGFALFSMTFFMNVWVMIDFGLYNLFSQEYFWKSFEYYSLAIAPIFATAYILFMNPRCKRFWEILLTLNTGWFVAMVIMNEFNIYHICRTMFVSHILILITCISMLIFAMGQIHNRVLSVKILLVSMIILPLFVSMELVEHYMIMYLGIPGMVNGMISWPFIGLTIFLMLILLHFCVNLIEDRDEKLRNEFQAKEKISQLKTNLEYTKIKLSLGQMKPHFMYNILSSIQAIIKINPDYAYEVLYEFTMYLRSKINTLQSDQLIPLREELENINTYLHIEEMRYPEKVKVKFDIECENFTVAPLSLEPFVENAVIHGILPKGEQGGEIIIHSRDDGAAWHIEIIDDGVGFDTNLVHDNKHVGLSNAKYRGEVLMNAVIDIKSEKHKGTCVYIDIPKKKKRG